VELRLSPPARRCHQFFVSAVLSFIPVTLSLSLRS
jgi:hypothetical protein